MTDGSVTPPSDPHPAGLDDLQFLAMFHYSIGAMAAMVALVPALHLFVVTSLTAAGEPVDSVLVQLLGENGAAVMAGFLLVFGIALGGLLVAAGMKMAKGRHLRFCIFASVLGLLFVPFGTMLGLVTLPLLRRPALRALFSD
ncbi:MAG: hypothetical protein AB7G12_00940 [Thermoanaerobaculia bacterium]